jgi:hypothetical protein
MAKAIEHMSNDELEAKRDLAEAHDDWQLADICDEEISRRSPVRQGRRHHRRDPDPWMDGETHW